MNSRSQIQHDVRPVAPHERVELLDVLRGLAITFILYMNIPYMSDYATLSDPDPRLLGWTMPDRAAFAYSWVIFGTMRGLLELLFGAGMMIALRHAMRPDGPAAALDSYSRRNLWLVAFGLAHALILMWPGDILLIYGIAALFLPPFRHLAPRRLFALGAALTLIAALPWVVPGYLESQSLVERHQAALDHQQAKVPLTDDDQDALKAWDERLEGAAFPARGAKLEEMAAEAKARLGPVSDYWQFTFDTWAALLTKLGELWWGVIEALGGMLVGAALYGWGIIQGRRSSAFYARLLILCYGLGIASRAASLSNYLEFRATPHAEIARYLTFFLSDGVMRLVISVGHIALVALLLRSRAGQALVRPLAANGKLPLSTYFSSSILGMLVLFPGFSLGLWGQNGAFGQLAIATSIILIQVGAANLWLRSHHTGPAEWLWKSLAYNRRQPFRRGSRDAGLPAGLQSTSPL